MTDSKALLEIQDISADPRYAAHPMVTGKTGLRFYASMPLITSEGHRIGSLCVFDQQPRALTDQQREVLTQLAVIVMQLLEARKAEQHLFRMGRLLDRSDDGICVMDAKTQQFEYANKNAQQYLGRSLPELRGLTPKDLQPVAAYADYQEALKPLYSNEKTYIDTETVGVRKDGTTFPAEVCLQLWQDGTKS